MRRSSGVGGQGLAGVAGPSGPGSRAHAASLLGLPANHRGGASPDMDRTHRYTDISCGFHAGMLESARFKRVRNGDETDHSSDDQSDGRGERRSFLEPNDGRGVAALTNPPCSPDAGSSSPPSYCGPPRRRESATPPRPAASTCGQAPVSSGRPIPGSRTWTAPPLPRRRSTAAGRGATARPTALPGISGRRPPSNSVSATPPRRR